MILDNQRENPSSSQDTQEEGIKAISSETLTSPEGQETQEQARQELEALKKQIENGKVTPAFIKPFIEGLAKIPSKNKPFILGGVLSALNKMGIALESIEGGKIALAPGNHGLRPDESIATQSEVIAFEQLLNDGLKTGQFSQKDLQRALLARTLPSINAFKDISLEKKSTSDYVVYLHKKYGIAFKISESASPEERASIEAGEGTKAYFKTIQFENKNAYINFKKAIQEAITDNQAEKEFLLSFYDDIYYNGGENIDDHALEEIKSTQTQNQAQIFTELNTLTPTQKLALGIHSENKAEELAEKWARDPVGAIKDTLANGGLSLGLIGGVIGAILGAFFGKGKWGFLIGFLGGVGVSAGGIEAIIAKMEGKGNKGEKSSGSETPPSASSHSSSPEGTPVLDPSFSSKIIIPEGGIEGVSKKELETLRNELLENEKFIGADAEILSLFKNNNDFDKRKDELKKLGIELTEENEKKYKIIFRAILEQRTKIIGAPNQGETIQGYLGRTSEEKSNEVLEGKTQTLGYIQEGKNYIIGKNGKPELIDYNNLSPELRKKVELLQSQRKKVGNFILILQTLAKKDEKKYGPILQEIQQKLTDTDVNQEKSIQDLDTWIDNKNSQLTGKGGDRGIILSDDVAVLTFVRENDSEIAQNELINRLFSLTGLHEEDIVKFVDDPSSDHEKIKKILGESDYKKLQIKIGEKKSDANKYFVENKEKLKNQIKSQNPSIQDNEIEKLLNDQYKPMIIGSFVDMYAKDAILEAYTDKLTEKDWRGGYNGANELLKMYSNIKGVGWGVVSDTSLDWGKEAFSIIAWEIVALAAGAVTMGAGTVAVNALVWGARGYKGICYLQRAATLANKGSKLYKAGRYAGMTLAEGSSFYLGHAGAQSLIEGENMYSTRGLVESIAFVGAFKGVSLVSSKLGLNWKSGETLVGKTVRLSTGLALETGALATIGLSLEGVIFEPGEWTGEMILQAFAMAILMRSMGHISEKASLKFTKKGDKVEISESKPAKAETKPEASESSIKSEIKLPQGGDQLSISFSGRKESLIKSILPKKPNETINIGGKDIKALEKGKFEYNGKIYDNADVLIKDLVTLGEQDILMSLQTQTKAKLNRNFNALRGKEIQIGDKNFRFSKEGEVNIIQIKEGNGWKKVEVSNLSETEGQILLDRLMGTGILDKISGSIKTKIEGIKLEDLYSKSEKEGIIRKYGQKGWDNLKKEFDNIAEVLPWKGGNTKRFNEPGVANTIKRGLFGVNGGGVGTLVLGVVTNEAWEFSQNHNRYKDYGWTEGAGSLINGLGFKYVGLVRGLAYQTILENWSLTENIF